MTTLKIREIATWQGLSCRELARRSGLSESTVRRYWKNPHQHIRTDTLGILARALRVHPRELLDDSAEQDAISSTATTQETARFAKDEG